jgi:competence protein ComEA
VDWLRLKLSQAIGGKEPVSKKLLLALAGLIATVLFLINGLNAGTSEKIVAASDLATDSVQIKPAKIYVHIVGEVETPGIYQLDSGSRIVDVIFAAGGFAKSADQSSINLAREISDGEQVVVLKAGANNGLTGVSSAIGSPGSLLISLNRASALELESLPGVGPALAGRMIDWRTANGGFRKKEDLLNISGIGDKLFAGLKDQVTL